LEHRKNAETVKLLFKMKNIEKAILNTSRHLKVIRVPSSSSDTYNRCFNIYNEASSYFFQCCGFLKSHYFEREPAPAGKSFFINSLYIPAYKKFLELKDNLSLIEVNDAYSECLKLLQNRIDNINTSLLELLEEVNRMK
jgi:hypothetical protein